MMFALCRLSMLDYKSLYIIFLGLEHFTENIFFCRISIYAQLFSLLSADIRVPISTFSSFDSEPEGIEITVLPRQIQGFQINSC